MFTNTNVHFVCFGEVLFDVFNGEKKIGGAPLNVALRIQSFNFPVAMISAVGEDEDGDRIVTFLNEKGITTNTINRVNGLQTGTVDVLLNEKGAATYTINYPVAWDAIKLTNTITNIVNGTNVFIYGSLACRDEVSKNTLFSLLDASPSLTKVFDVNLRAPFYTYELLNTLMGKATIIKFNDDELLEIVNNLGGETEQLEEAILFVAKTTNTQTICVTRGEHGAILYTGGNWYYNKGYAAKVADTVGAGDSFLATLLCKLIADNQPQLALDMACAVGCLVASAAGANPQISLKAIEALLSS